MSTFSADRPLETTSGARRIAHKVWREVRRPFRSKVRASSSADRPLETTSGGRRIAYKVWREVRRPFRSKVRASTEISEPAASFNQLLTAGSLTFSNAAVAPPQSAVETKRP